MLTGGPHSTECWFKAVYVKPVSFDTGNVLSYGITRPVGTVGGGLWHLLERMATGDEGDVGTVLGAGGWGRPADQSQATRGQRWRQGGAGAGEFGGGCAEWRSSSRMAGGGVLGGWWRAGSGGGFGGCLRLCPSQRGRHQRWGGQCGEEQLDRTGVEERYGRMEVGARFWPAEGLGGHQLERRCEVTPPGSPARSCWDWREDQDTVLRVNAVVRWANPRDEDTAEASAARLRRVQSGASGSVTAGSTHAAAAPQSNAFTVNLLLGAAQSTRRCSRVTPPSGRFLQRGPLKTHIAHGCPSWLADASTAATSTVFTGCAVR